MGYDFGIVINSCIFLVMDLCILFSAFKYARLSKTRNVFFLFATTVTITQFVDIFQCAHVIGLLQDPILINFAFIIYFIGLTANGYFWFLYLYSLIFDKFNKAICIAVSAPLEIMIVCAILSPITHSIYYIDSNLVYQRGDLFILQVILPYIYVLFALVFVVIAFIKSKNRKRVWKLFINFFLFMAPTVVGVSLQLLVLAAGFPACACSFVLFLIFTDFFVDESLETKRLKGVEALNIQIRGVNEKLQIAQKKLTQNNYFLLNALGSVVEFRDIESGNHVERVSAFTKALLNEVIALYPEVNISEEQVEMISQAASLHDVGKIAIPDSILNKPGKLTPEEFIQMKTHTTKGCEILEKFKVDDTDFYKYCYEICRWHHERTDGRGYPDHLKGEEIPIWCEVTAIADCFDALTSKRPYKDPFEIDMAYNMIINGECGMFSEKVINAFANIEDKFREIIYKTWKK